MPRTHREGERVADDVPDLAIVYAALHGTDQCRRDVACFQRGKRLTANARERCAANVAQRVVVQGVELQVDLEARLQLGQRIDEGRILGNADAVRVQHDMANRTASCGRQNFEDLGMDGWLAARDLDQIGLALAGHQGIEHAFDFGQAAMRVTLGRRVGKADRTGEIAGLVDLDDGQAGMLLVVGAQPAIPGTPVVGARLRCQRPVAGLEIFEGAAPVDRIVGHQGLHHPVFGTALGIVDGAVFLDDLGRHETEAGLTKRCRLAEEEIGRRLAYYAVVHAPLLLRIMAAAYRSNPRQTTWNRLNGPITVA
jgi:hypothetical protein